MKAHLKLLIAATLLVVFGLGAVAGYFGERYVVHQRRAVRPREHVGPADWMARTLSLDPAQVEKVRAIFKGHEDEIGKIYADSRARMETVRARMKTEIDAALTPAQIAKLDRIMKEYRQRQESQRRGERAPRRDPGAPDQGERR